MILDDYGCALYSARVEETSNHPFFTCSFSSWCWRLLRIHWNQNLHCFDRIVEAHRDFSSRMLREILIVTFWAIWKHGNKKGIFKEELALVLLRAKPSLKQELEVWLCNIR
ncbi:hypothetical protein SETIT_7G033200v2 [Setaria italica]|uniref:Reverse transcriptase zinc-binding domain-containing protein n=1 Tax=Setaria italica TaxID=4555 RepID=A0A368RRR3_SETIT|nr:hypothetical protein SETIT_7G033200v2 [Setaria italica]